MMQRLIYLLVALLLLGCEPNLDYEIHGYTEKIIVEGSIGNNEYPRVYLSRNVPLWLQVDSSTILNKVIRTAKVTVSDGEETEVLTSRWDRDHFPPYVYKGSKLKGESGKTYYLTVEYGGYTIKAQTTIPQVAKVLNFEKKPVEVGDSLFILSMNVLVDSTLQNGFRFYSRKMKDGYFVETPIVYNEKFDLSGVKNFLVSPRPKEKDPSFSEGSYFAKGDSVLIKICTLDSLSTKFFSTFSLNNFPGKDFFIGESKGLSSNISSPGFGLWYGYGVKSYMVVVE